MDKYVWEPGDIKIDPIKSIPDNLKPIVKNAPKGDQAKLATYLLDKISKNVITSDEVVFLLHADVFTL